MRLNSEIIDYFKRKTESLPTKAEVYLFGSRVAGQLKGGDLDIMILSEEPLDRMLLRQIRIDFFKRFGWQKLDLVNFTHGESHPFKSLILDEAKRL